MPEAPKKTPKKNAPPKPKTDAPAAEDFVEIPDALEAAFDVVTGDIFDAPELTTPTEEEVAPDVDVPEEPRRPAAARPEGFVFNIFGDGKRTRSAPAAKARKGAPAGEPHDDPDEGDDGAEE